MSDDVADLNLVTSACDTVNNFIANALPLATVQNAMAKAEGYYSNIDPSDDAYPAASAAIEQAENNVANYSQPQIQAAAQGAQDSIGTGVSAATMTTAQQNAAANYTPESNATLGQIAANTVTENENPKAVGTQALNAVSSGDLAQLEAAASNALQSIEAKLTGPAIAVVVVLGLLFVAYVARSVR